MKILRLPEVTLYENEIVKVVGRVFVISANITYFRKINDEVTEIFFTGSKDKGILVMCNIDKLEEYILNSEE